MSQVEVVPTGLEAGTVLIMTRAVWGREANTSAAMGDKGRTELPVAMMVGEYTTTYLAPHE